MTQVLHAGMLDEVAGLRADLRLIAGDERPRGHRHYASGRLSGRQGQSPGLCGPARPEIGQDAR